MFSLRPIILAHTWKVFGSWGLGEIQKHFLLLLLQFLALFNLYIFIQCLKATLYSQLLQNIDYIPHVVKYVLVVYLKPAWKIPWTEEPGRLQFMGSQRVGHNWAASLSFLFTFKYLLNDCWMNVDITSLSHLCLLLSAWKYTQVDIRASHVAQW